MITCLYENWKHKIEKKKHIGRYISLLRVKKIWWETFWKCDENIYRSVNELLNSSCSIVLVGKRVEEVNERLEQLYAPSVLDL